MHGFLSRISGESEPPMDVEIVGKMTDLDRSGGIFFARVKDATRGQWPDTYVVKRLCLPEQNVYAVVVGVSPKTKTVRGIPRRNVLFASESRKECKLWRALWCNREGRKEARIVKVAWTLASDPERPASALLECNEYINEAAVGVLASSVRLPHVVKTYAAWIERGFGHILMDYGGHTLQRLLVDLTVAELKSSVVQTLVTLGVMQQLINLKHHDVHLDNLFVNRLRPEDVFDGQQLNSKGLWTYNLKWTTLDGTAKTLRIRLPHSNVLARLGDFGLSSATDPATNRRVQRFDYHLLNACEAEWGEWSGKTAGQESYDTVTMLSKFFLPDERKLTTPACFAYVTGLWNTLLHMDPTIEVSNIGRPFRGGAGQVNPFDFLASEAFQEFHATSDDADELVIC